jgi:drug/metabolite transporter (DMT)-like permease
MIALALLIICFALFNLSFRQAQRLGLDLHVLGVLLFGTGALLYALLYAAAPAPLSMTVVLLAVVAGVLFTGMYVLMIPTMSDRGVSLMTALQQLSVLIPMLASLLIYRETPSLVNAIGAGLCLVAMPFLALDRGVSREGVTGRKLLLFVGLMVVNGIALTAAKIFHELNAPEQLNGYMLILLFVAALGCVPFAAVSMRHRPRVRYGPLTLGWGLYLGLVLALGQLFMLLSLRHYPGVVVYPLSQAANVSLVTLCSLLLWRERPGLLGFAGIALAVVAVVLVNL